MDKKENVNLADFIQDQVLTKVRNFDCYTVKIYEYIAATKNI